MERHLCFHTCTDVHSVFSRFLKMGGLGKHHLSRALDDGRISQLENTFRCCTVASHDVGLPYPFWKLDEFLAS